MRENEYGISGHLHIFTFYQLFIFSSDMQFHLFTSNIFTSDIITSGMVQVRHVHFGLRDFPLGIGRNEQITCLDL